MGEPARQSTDWVAVLVVRSEPCSEWLISLLTGILQGFFSKMRKNGDFYEQITVRFKLVSHKIP